MCQCCVKLLLPRLVLSDASLRQNSLNVFPYYLLINCSTLDDINEVKKRVALP